MKPNQSHGVYLDILRRMSPEDRLRKAFELSDLSRSLFVHGLRRTFPELEPDEFRALVRSRLDKCHKRKHEAQILGIRAAKDRAELI